MAESIQEEARASETPHRVQLSRKKDWRMPENTFKVDRSTRWGNPATVTATCPADVAVALFERSLLAWGGLPQRGGGRVTLADIRRELRGKNLACWCKLSEPCHADVLLRIANEAPE